MILGGTEATAETGAFFRSRVGARDDRISRELFSVSAALPLGLRSC